MTRTTDQAGRLMEGMKPRRVSCQETANEFSRFYGTKSTPAEQTPLTAIALAIADYRSQQFPIWEFVTQLHAAEDQLREIDTLRAQNAALVAAVNLALNSRWLSIDSASNRTPEAVDVRAAMCAALSQAQGDV